MSLSKNIAKLKKRKSEVKGIHYDPSWSYAKMDKAVKKAMGPEFEFVGFRAGEIEVKRIKHPQSGKIDHTLAARATWLAGPANVLDALALGEIRLE